jgi:hypothetical protein
MHVVKTFAKHISRHYYINASPIDRGVSQSSRYRLGKTNNTDIMEKKHQEEKPAVTATARSTRGGAVVVYQQPASKRRTFAHGIIGLAFDVVSVTPRFPDAEFPGGNNLLKGSFYRWPKRFWAWARLGKAGVKSELVTDSLATTTVLCTSLQTAVTTRAAFCSCFGGLFRVLVVVCRMCSWCVMVMDLYGFLF